MSQPYHGVTSKYPTVIHTAYTLLRVVSLLTNWPYG